MVTKNACKLFARSAGIALLLLAGMSQMFGTSGKRDLTVTTVCEIVAKPNRFNKKIVKIRAFVKSDMIEHTVLLDSSCESEGISLRVPAKLQEQPDFQELYKALSRNGPSTTDQFHITGTFTGVFRYYPNRSSEKRVLEATSVQNLEIKPADGSSVKQDSKKEIKK